VKQHVNALNYLIRLQQKIVTWALGSGEAGLYKEDLLDRHGTAMAEARDNSRKYKKAKSASTNVNGKKMKQQDPLRGKIERPLRDVELGYCHKYCLVDELAPGVTEYPKSFKHRPEFVSATNRLVLANTHNGIMRGDDIRSPLVTWAHKGILPLPEDASIEDNAYIFFLLKDTGKCEKDGIPQLAGFLRHKDPLLCPANAEGEYVILRFGRDGMQDLPNIMDGSVNWMEECWYLTDPSGKRPMQYSRKKSGKSSKDPDEITEGHYEFFCEIKEACGLDFINLVTHMRKMGAMYAEEKGCSEDAINRIGRWITEMINKTCREHYLKNLPVEALLALAGFIVGDKFTCVRGRVVDVGNLDEIEKDEDFVAIIEFLVPGLLKLARKAKDAIDRPKSVTDPNVPISVSNAMFTMGCVATVCVWIQDAPVMLRRLPKLKTRRPYTFLENADIKEQWERVKTRVLQAVDEEVVLLDDRQLERRQIMTTMTRLLGQKFDAHETRMRRHFDEKLEKIEKLQNSERTSSQNDANEQQARCLIEQARVLAPHIVQGLPIVAGARTSDASAVGEKGGDSSASSQEPALEQHKFKPIKGYKEDEMIHSIVSEWVTEVQKKMKEFEETTAKWYDNKGGQRQLREKHLLVFNAVKNAAEFHNKDILEYAKDVDRLWGEIKEELDVSGGKYSDIDHVCRHAAGDRDDCLKDFDAVKECIRKRRADQAEKTRERANARKRSRVASSAASVRGNA